MKSFKYSILAAACLIALSSHGFAASWAISTASTTKQTLATGETGTVAGVGSLTVTENNVAITVTGNSTITNSGTIQQATVNTGGNAGNGRAIRDNTGGLTLTVNNGSSSNSAALIQTADADVIQMKVAGSSVTLNNYGTLYSLNTSGSGNQAVDWNALNTTTGTNTLNNFSTGIITASESDAVRPGVNGVISNAGTIKSTTSTGSSRDGVDVQTNTGVSVTNSGLIEGGRHAVTGGALNNTVTFTTSVTNNLGGTIQGDNGSGINLDGFDSNQTATIVNHGTITGNGHDIGDGLSHDGDGIDVDGLVNITNTGLIRSVNAYSTGTAGVAESEGITVGGGIIVNSGTIEGGGTNAAVQTGADNDTLSNSGTIRANGSGKAIDLGAGNNTLDLTGGSASVIGNISGGISGTNALTIDPGFGHAFSYSGTMSNFSSTQIKSGRFNLSGVLTSGSTTVNGGTLAGSGTLGGLVVVATSGTISPGSGLGKLTLQTGLDLAGGGSFLWQLGSLNDNNTGVAGTDFDQIAIDGNLALGGSSRLTLDFSSLGGTDPSTGNAFWNSNHRWTIVNGSGATNVGSTNFALLSNAAFAVGTFTSSSDGLGNVTLEYQAVPQPQTWATLLSGIAMLGFWRRLRRRNA